MKLKTSVEKVKLVNWSLRGSIRIHTKPFQLSGLQRETTRQDEPVKGDKNTFIFVM